MTQGPEGTIHLDTSFLIRALVPASVESESLRSWLQARRSIAISALVWGEFLCGPVDEGVEELALRVVRTRVPLSADDAASAARLFNETGRRRGTFHDCLIAATAMAAGAVLATADRADFGRFVVHGLELAG
jgi:predicted nucleic acid-binding protein